MKLRYLVAALTALTPTFVMADGAGIISDEQSGKWFATHHTTDGGITTDVCVAGTVNEQRTMFTLRASRESVEIRIINNKWNLPEELDNFVNIVSGDFQQEYRFMGMSSNILSTHLEEVDTKPLLSALSNGASAELHFGEKKVQNISLSGAGKALNSFKNCVRGIGTMDLGNPAGPVDTPF